MDKNVDKVQKKLLAENYDFVKIYANWYNVEIVAIAHFKLAY